MDKNHFYKKDQFQQTVDYIRHQTHYRPEIGIILGSGMSPLADSIEQADVIALAVDHQPHKAVFLPQTVQRCRQFELFALAQTFGDVLPQVLKDLGLDDIEPKEGQVFVLRQIGDAQVGRA